MLTDLKKQLKDMVQPGDIVTCAVSGGADSMALLWSMYLLQDKLGIRLSAAQYNHGLRGAESDEDEAFVRSFCDRYDIPLYVGAGCVTAGEKGLEAAAREARYGFFAIAHFCGGDEENRTPVRKFIHKRLSERSLRLTFPHIKDRKQTLMLGSFIVHGRLKALPAHVHHWMTLLSRPWYFR